MLAVSVGCDIINPIGEEKNEKPTITDASGWVVENIDPSFWTKWGQSSDATAFIDFWVFANDPDGIEDITYVAITSPDGGLWVLRYKDVGFDHYDDRGKFFGGWRRYYSLDLPNLVVLGRYTVLIRDSAGNEVTDTFSVNSPGTKSGSGSIYSESYAGSLSGGAKMLHRASIRSATKSSGDITIQFSVSDSRFYNGYVWFYDASANYITSSGYFKSKVNDGAGLRTNGTTNTLKVQPSDLELGDFTFDDIKWFHVILQDGAQYAPSETTRDHISISQYEEIL
jgi:hypothetical protein